MGLETSRAPRNALTAASPTAAAAALPSENAARAALLDAARKMGGLGLDDGSVSLRWHRGGSDGLLVTPSAPPYDRCTVDDLVWMPIVPSAVCRLPSAACRLRPTAYGLRPARRARCPTATGARPRPGACARRAGVPAGG